MLDEMIKELDEKVELLINKNTLYKNETERLRGLLNSAIDENSVSQSSNDEIYKELKPLARSILAHVEKADGEQTYA